MITRSQATRSWSPDGDAHLIFQWVKMEGKSQGWVASAFGINQSTVSRIIQRYERWQAHAKERENGRLDHAERLRAQRWLTYERNELILASCMRIANELEGSIDTSRSTIRRAASDPSQEIEIRTQHACVDRTSMVSRFLRLAHRINMEQLKLAELDPPPLAAPLSPEELAAEEAQAAADAAELAAARQRGADIPVCQPEGSTQESEDRGQETGDGGQDSVDSQPPTASPRTEYSVPSTPPGAPHDGPPETANASAPPLNLEPGTLNPAEGRLHNVHNLHNENVPNIAATTSDACTCIVEARIHKNAPGVCITDCDDPTSNASDETRTSNNHAVTAATT